MRIGLDLDSVLFDFELALRDELVEERGLDAMRNIGRMKDWDFWRDWGFESHESFLAYLTERAEFDFYRYGYLMDDKAPEALRRAREAGHILVFITSRPDTLSVVINSQHWIENTLGLPSDGYELYFEDEKWLVPTDSMIDDSPRVLKGYRDNDKHFDLFQMNQAWNEYVYHGTHVSRVSDYLDIVAGEAGGASIYGDSTTHGPIKPGGEE